MSKNNRGKTETPSHISPIDEGYSRKIGALFDRMSGGRQTLSHEQFIAALPGFLPSAPPHFRTIQPFKLWIAIDTDLDGQASKEDFIRGIRIVAAGL